MTMKDGIKQIAATTLDIKDDICTKMIDAGVDPIQALKASTVVTKENIDNIIDKHMDNQPAAGITKTLSEVGKGNKQLS